MSERPKRKVEFIESYWTGGKYGSDYVWNDNHGELVRCEDCEYYKDGFCYNPNTFDDEKTRGNTVPDWYCADGKGEQTMADREKVIKGLHCCSHTDGINCLYCPYDNDVEDCTALMSMDVLELLKDHENEYEKGFNDAMLGKQELMYEGEDGKWYKKDW